VHTRFCWENDDKGIAVLNQTVCHEDVWVEVAVRVQSFLIKDLYVEASAQFVAVGARGNETKCQLDSELDGPN